MISVPRYIDDQPRIFFWPLDVFLVFSTGLFVGIIAGHLFYFAVIAFIIAYAFTKFKAGKPDSFLYHALYWYGFLQLKGIPPSYMRRFIE